MTILLLGSPALAIFDLHGPRPPPLGVVIARAFFGLMLGLVSVLLLVVQRILLSRKNRELVLRGEDRHVSPIVFLGGFCGSLCIVIAPLGSLRSRLLIAPTPLLAEFIIGLVTWWMVPRRGRDRPQRPSNVVGKR